MQAPACVHNFTRMLTMDISVLYIVMKALLS